MEQTQTPGPEDYLFYTPPILMEDIKDFKHTHDNLNFDSSLREFGGDYLKPISREDDPSSETDPQTWQRHRTWAYLR